MDGVITRQSEEYIMMMRMLKKCSKEILEFQDLPVPIAGEVYMTGEQICDRKDHQVVVEVADNGSGIPDRAKAQVFEMFYTGQSRIADSHRSLGLGLPLCRAILTAHGGTLTLRDNIPNGSVFSFALPQSEVNIHE